MDRLKKRKKELSKLDTGVDEKLLEEIETVAKDTVQIDGEIDGLANNLKKDRSKLRQRLLNRKRRLGDKIDRCKDMEKEIEDIDLVIGDIERKLDGNDRSSLEERLKNRRKRLLLKKADAVKANDLAAIAQCDDDLDASKLELDGLDLKKGDRSSLLARLHARKARLSKERANADEKTAKAELAELSDKFGDGEDMDVDGLHLEKDRSKLRDRLNARKAKVKGRIDRAAEIEEEVSFKREMKRRA